MFNTTALNLQLPETKVVTPVGPFTFTGLAVCWKVGYIENGRDTFYCKAGKVRIHILCAYINITHHRQFPAIKQLSLQNTWLDKILPSHY